ncbi:hypothetical protein, partial [Cellulomonas olei]
ALAGLVAPAGAYGGRAGVISGMTVSGTSGWMYTVGPGHVATPAGAGEVLPWANAADFTVGPVSPAPGSGSRIDRNYALHTRNLEGDTASEPVIDVVVGDPSTGNPAVPAIPAGAVELGRVTIPSGATGTAGGSFSTSSVQYTAGRGAAIPVPGTTQRDAISWASALLPAVVRLLSTGEVQVNRGSGWRVEGNPVAKSYTPVLSAATAPSMTLIAAGRYVEIGDLCAAWFSVKVDAVSNVGAGTYTITLPKLVDTTVTNTTVIGRASLLDNSASNRCGVELTRTGAGDAVTMFYQSAYPIGSRQAVNNAAPWTWAAGDTLEGFVVYPAA